MVNTVIMMMIVQSVSHAQTQIKPTGGIIVVASHEMISTKLYSISLSYLESPLSLLKDDYKIVPSIKVQITLCNLSFSLCDVV